MMRKARILGFAALLLASGLIPSMATSVVPMNIVDLVQRASRVFEGRCTAIAHETVQTQDGTEMPIVRYTFDVVDGLYGVSTKQISISHLGKFQDGRRFFADPDFLGVPKYQMGQSYILFVNHDSGTTGLSVPIGFQQGVFFVQGELAVSGSDEEQLMKGLDQALTGTNYQSLLPQEQKTLKATVFERGMDKNTFKALVRDLIAGNIKAPSLAEVQQ